MAQDDKPKVDGRAKGNYHAPPPVDEQGRFRKRISMDEQVRIKARRDSKAQYMRRWRAANPELAAQKNREYVRAYNARKKAEKAGEVIAETP